MFDFDFGIKKAIKKKVFFPRPANEAPDHQMASLTNALCIGPHRFYRLTTPTRKKSSTDILSKWSYNLGVMSDYPLAEDSHAGFADTKSSFLFTTIYDMEIFIRPVLNCIDLKPRNHEKTTHQAK